MRVTLVLSVLVGIGIGPATPLAMAQSPGTFTPTGNMTTSRESHTATLLNNGKVLIVGGFALSGGAGGIVTSALASAELYDPSTGTFAGTGTMATARWAHSATLLPDGKVLITGGSYGKNSLYSVASAEVYNPSTGTFTPTGDMTTARIGHTSTLLNTGKVLIAGGGQGDAYTSAELYDPSTGTFSATGSMQSTGPATLLPNGKVLIDGNPAELYDPATGTFSLTNGSAWRQIYADLSPESATLLEDGNVLSELTDECSVEDYAEVYDPSTGYFMIAGNVTAGRGSSTATLLPDGTVLITGGGSGGPVNGFTEPELYHPLTGVFLPTGPMDTPRLSGDAATLLPDGTVLFSGGDACCAATIATASLYHPAELVSSPVLYSLPGGTQGAILHGLTQAVVSPASSAAAGEPLEIYGAGLTEGGSIPPQVSIGGQLAEVLFFGDAPGYPGLNQINVLVPAGIAPGPAVPVHLNYINRPSNEVTVAIQ